MKKGILLSNLGSPDSPTPTAVKKYLKQFLMDPYVIDIAFPLRYVLVNWLIVPKRSVESAEAYSKVWTTKGSPLVTHSDELTQKVIQAVDSKNLVIDFAMRYGKPSLESVLKSMLDQGVEDLKVLPLYPQHAWATSESTEAEVKRILKKLNYTAKVSFIEAFYNDPSYIKSAVQVYREELSKHEAFDHYLFSYHGIPERHVKRTDPTGNYCLEKKDCCLTPCEANKKCYKHHCFVNTELVCKELGLEKSKYSIAFQSRLGKDPWLKPFTDFELVALAEKGIKKIAVFCPSFVADCLETIEEIGMRGNEDFIKAGGDKLVLVPSLNSSDVWANCIKEWIV